MELLIELKLDIATCEGPRKEPRKATARRQVLNLSDLLKGSDIYTRGPRGEPCC